MITDMISTAPGFQTSVNIAYDLFNSRKVQSLIPTTTAINLFEDILLSTVDTATNRSRILIGPYGKGKSHIILSILSFLCHKDGNSNAPLLHKIHEVNPKLYDYAIEYISSSKRLLPVIINGSNISLVQSFMGALYNTLKTFELAELMPETNFQAAIKMISLWKSDYPDTLCRFQNAVNMPADEFAVRLSNFDVEAYTTFEKIYPSLTSGSEFNPFSGFDVIELYEKVINVLPNAGFSGIFVVYDEFSKYLESSITKASISDVKMLQDFAEKCCRSGAKQMHLLLISHKEIQNYIDILPKQKVDGWKGVSERFSHVHMYSDFSQIYEIIAQAIIKEPDCWDRFYQTHQYAFDEVQKKYSKSKLFADCNQEDLRFAIVGCYPLHPVTTFLLPRISEKVAQNERTLFTFISGQEASTLSSILKKLDGDFPLVTVDALYDYFAPQMRKEVYTSEIHQLYRLTTGILSKLEPDSLHAKIVKAIALIYCLGQFELLAPTVDTILDIYASEAVSAEEINNVILELVQKQCVIYLRRSNAFLKLKESSGVDIYQTIEDVMHRRSQAVTTIDLLNAANLEPYTYPLQYNDQLEMTRFFQFVFISANQLYHIDDFQKIVDQYSADGVIFGIFPDIVEQTNDFVEVLCQKSLHTSRAIFVLPDVLDEIHGNLKMLDAVQILRENAREDDVLFDEYDIIYQDLSEVIQRFIFQYLHPELHAVKYFYAGQERPLYRKAQLSQLLSEICHKNYPNTPVVNNEVLNRNKLTSVALNSRTKLLAGLLATPLQHNLGMLGSGQEVSFMRSTLVTTHILQEDKNLVSLNYEPENRALAEVLRRIDQFLENTQNTGRTSFAGLYNELIGAEAGIGMRKGLIPIYLAVVLRKYQGHIVIYDQFGEVSITPNLLNQINDEPSRYDVKLENWSDTKQAFIKQLEQLFGDYIYDSDKAANNYSYLLIAMGRWYLSLPKYSKELKRQYNGNTASEQFSVVDREKIGVLSLLKQTSIGTLDLLFAKLPKCFGLDEVSSELSKKLAETKQYFDSAKLRLEEVLIEDTKCIFCEGAPQDATLTSVAADWNERLSSVARNKLYPNTAERIFPAIEKATNDEHLFVENLAKSLTGLHIGDWNEDSIVLFLNRLAEYKATIDAESNCTQDDQESLPGHLNYAVTFISEDGNAVRKTFARVERSKRSTMLYNRVSNAIKEMGQSISPQEKRQVLMEILEDLC